MGESLTKRSNSLSDRKGDQRGQPRSRQQSQEAGTLPRKARKALNKTPHRARTGATDAAPSDKLVTTNLNKCRAARGALELRGVSGRPADTGGEGVGSRGKATEGFQGASALLPASRPASAPKSVRRRAGGRAGERSKQSCPSGIRTAPGHGEESVLPQVTERGRCRTLPVRLDPARNPGQLGCGFMLFYGTA